MVRTDPGTLSETTVARIDGRGNPPRNTDMAHGWLPFACSPEGAAVPAGTSAAGGPPHPIMIPNGLDHCGADSRPAPRPRTIHAIIPITDSSVSDEIEVRVAGPARRIAVGENNSCGLLPFSRPLRLYGAGPNKKLRSCTGPAIFIGNSCRGPEQYSLFTTPLRHWSSTASGETPHSMNWWAPSRKGPALSRPGLAGMGTPSRARAVPRRARCGDRDRW